MDRKNRTESIQDHIISKLKNADVLRYADLCPEGAPNDLFNYHLQHLVKKGLLIKEKSKYRLSALGLKYVADPHTSNQSPLDALFKVNVITIVSRMKDGKIEILNQIRKSNPSYGKIGVMGGVVLKGELLEEAGSRKLKQETGLDAEFKILGCERRIMYKSGELFSDVLFPISYADKYSGELIEDTDFGHNMWVPINTAIKNESAEFDSIKSINIVLKALKKGNLKSLPFFFEENTQSDILAK